MSNKYSRFKFVCILEHAYDPIRSNKPTNQPTSQLNQNQIENKIVHIDVQASSKYR